MLYYFRKQDDVILRDIVPPATWILLIIQIKLIVNSCLCFSISLEA